MKNLNFVPKDVQSILSWHKISEKCNEQNVFHKKAVLKNFALFTGKHLCWNLCFNKNAGLQAWSFIKKRLQHRCFLANIEKILRTLIMKTSLNGYLWETFSQKQNKTKQNKKTALKLRCLKNSCLFMMFFIILFFSISPLHVSRRLPYILKDDSSENFKTTTNERLILDQWKN